MEIFIIFFASAFHSFPYRVRQIMYKLIAIFYEYDCVVVAAAQYLNNVLTCSQLYLYSQKRHI